ncbi:MAG: glycosyltransferase [Oscillospiraceae bacterium]|nr:glycosyltransferase [Oscillospiraceae bacterium]
MKVCLMNDSFPPVIDGVVNVMMNYANHLMTDHSAKVIVATPRYPGADYDKYPYPVVPYQSFDTTKLASGYRAGNPFASKAIAQLAAFRPDIIHTHCPASATVLARLLREETAAPIVLTYHTKYDIDIQRAVKIKSAANETIRAMVSNIEACDEVWVVSKGAGESLKALGYSGDYLVMNNGVDFAKGRVDPETVEAVTGQYDLPAGVPVFLFVGRLMTYKGLPLVLDALKLFWEETGRDFRMVFVGKGPDREKLEKQAAENGIAEKCIFVGPIYERDKLRAWNTRADLFLFPSTFDTNGLVVREAAACGLASVLVEGSCAAEGITDGRNGFTIEETPRAMAELLKKVSGGLEHLHEVGQHAMDEIYLSWKDCVDRANERYALVLDEKRRGVLRERRRDFTDLLVTATARSMAEQEKYRRARQTVLEDLKDTAVGMMENIQEAEESVERLFADLGKR